jgi:hypothetical protein
VRELAGVANQVMEDLDDATSVSQHIGHAARHFHHKLNTTLGLHVQKAWCWF